jgi:hypothetical protein
VLDQGRIRVVIIVRGEQRDCIYAACLGDLCALDALGRREGAGLDDHRHPPVGGTHRRLRYLPPFVRPQERPLSGGPGREDAVPPRRDEPVHELDERLVVDMAVAMKGCDQRDDHAGELQLVHRSALVHGAPARSQASSHSKWRMVWRRQV